VDEDSTADKAFVEAAGWGGPNIWFIRVPEPKAATNRLHFRLEGSRRGSRGGVKAGEAGCYRGLPLPGLLWATR
jgi:hypothetical protein